MSGIHASGKFISHGHLNLINDFKLLTLQITYLIRSYLVAVASGHGDATAVESRLYGIPVKFQSKFQLVYGVQVGEELLNILSLYLMKIFAVIHGMKAGDVKIVDENTRALYKISGQMAAYLTKINPFWNDVQWENLFYAYTSMVLQSITMHLNNEFNRELDVHERLMHLALTMGDYLADGTVDYIAVTSPQGSTANEFL